MMVILWPDRAVCEISISRTGPFSSVPFPPGLNFSGNNAPCLNSKFFVNDTILSSSILESLKLKCRLTRHLYF